MQEIKIPEGCKASIDFEKRVVVIESERSKFKRGDILFASDFEYTWIIIYNKTNADRDYDYFAMLNSRGHINYNEKCDPEFFRLATPSEQQLLFNALAKEGKKWNPETLKIEDIEKDILVPESIGIYRCKEDFDGDGDGLYISFNDNTQLLCYNSQYKVWGACYLHRGFDKVQCKLTPCKREYLKEGDTAFHAYSETPDFSNKYQYSKIIDNYCHVFYNSLKSVIRQSNKYPFWYKVEPLNK